MSLIIALTFLLLTNIHIINGEAGCLDEDTLHINWHTLNTYGVTPEFDYEIEFDKFNLEIIISVNLSYLGYSIDKDDNKLGTTYVLDFESTEAHILPLNKPGTCSNRNAIDFQNAPFTEWFINSPANEFPVVGTTQYLAYPGGGRDWFIEATDCSTIHYRGHFTYKELFDECTNAEGDIKYSLLETDDNWINLTLTFYINIVSPLINDEDSTYYRVYQLLSAPFVVAIQKTIMVLEPVGIRLFTMSIIGVYKQRQQNDFRLILVTETGEYLKLNTPQLVTYPWDLENNHINFQISNQYETLNNENPCLNNKAYFCSQIWEIYADNVPCPPSDFSGIYGLQFAVICNDDGSTDDSINEERLNNCQRWLALYEDKIDLSTQLIWKDEICEAEMWTIHFDASMSFYDNANFNIPVDSSHLYQVGEDKIYIQIEVNVHDIYDVFKAKLINVWLCTTDPIIGEPGLDIQTGDGGCLSSNIDDDGPYFIIQDYDAVMLYNATHLDENDPIIPSNIVRFSFITPVTIVRDTLYIHAQLSLSLVENQNARRRLIDDDEPKSDQIKHFIGKVNTDTRNAQPYQHIIEIEQHKKNTGFYDEPIEKIREKFKKNRYDNDYIPDDNNGPYIIMTQNVYNLVKIISGIVGVLIIVNVFYMMYWRCNGCKNNVYIYEHSEFEN